ncbi:MAG: hypothetical protein E7149_05715 [Rikenellaceae bacterium]|nr:hypothetical protein [Rikenellaceae bacterium]
MKKLRFVNAGLSLVAIVLFLILPFWKVIGDLSGWVLLENIDYFSGSILFELLLYLIIPIIVFVVNLVSGSILGNSLMFIPVLVSVATRQDCINDLQIGFYIYVLISIIMFLLAAARTKTVEAEAESFDNNDNE